jgi:two-component system sensor histidine kinase KdpD
MTKQRYSGGLSIASPSEIEHTAQQLTTVRNEFLTTGILTLRTPRPIILNSWQRCNDLQVNPARRYAPLAVARESQLQNLREANEVLVRATRSVMSHLTDFLAASGYVVVLSDAKGRLLDVVGDATIRRRLARIDFVPGGDWSEAAAGTNAIGTALADGHGVQLMAAEHYCDGWQDLTCTATPIRHPFTGEVMGILDITGDYRLIRSFLTNTLAEATLEASQQVHTLLTTNHGGEYAMNGRNTTFSFPGSTSLFEINLNNNTSGYITTQSESENPYADEIQSQLAQQERRALDAERLAAASGAISSSLDLSVALDKVAEQLAHILRLECAAACIFDETDRGEGYIHIWSEQKPLRSETISTMEALLGQAEAVSLIRERGEPVLIDDILTSPFLPTTFVEKMGIRSMALFPLTTARGVIGFIAAPRYTPYHWIVDDVRLGLAFATQSATAIDNARLFDTLQQHNRHVEALNAMAQLLSTLPDPGQHFDFVMERIADIMNLDAGMVFLYDEGADSLILVAQYGQPEIILSDLCAHPLKPLYEVAKRVTMSGEACLINDLKSDGRILHQLHHALDFCDVMIVPLAASGVTLGVLLVGSHSARGLTQDDLALFKTIGQQLGMALKNAQLLRAESEMGMLREADRLKSAFLATVSHDLRSPLTAIRASVESLLDQGIVQSGREQENLLHNISSQASRLGRLVDQLLDLSKIEAGVLPLDRDWTELPVLIADTIAKFEGLNKGCRIERSLSPLPLQYVDPDCLVQVLWNLLENAYRYAPPYSAIKVEARWTETEVLIEVSDRGPGVPLEEREKIFRRFYRLDRDHNRAAMQGNGLGLAICRGIVEAHGGSIWVEERLGGGSVFYFTLPLPKITPVELEALAEAALCDISTKERELYEPLQTANFASGR